MYTYYLLWKARSTFHSKVRQKSEELMLKPVGLDITVGVVIFAFYC